MKPAIIQQNFAALPEELRARTICCTGCTLESHGRIQ